MAHDDIFHKVKVGSVEKESWVPSEKNIKTRKNELAKKIGGYQRSADIKRMGREKADAERSMRRKYKPR